MFTADGATNSPMQLPVTLSVTSPAPPSIRIGTSSLTFAGVSEGDSPAPQSIAISSGGDGTLNWQASAMTFNGGSWLALAPASGSGSSAVNVSAAPGSLPPGVYTGRITVSADGAANSPMIVPVTLTLARARPSFTAQTVVNAGSLLPGPVAPGEIISIYGARLGPRGDGAIFALDPVTQKIPLSLNGATVSFDGIRAPLLFVAYNQINLQAPFELTGKTSTRMTVTVDGMDPADLSLHVREAAPGVFTGDGARATALNEDGSPNTADNPAAIGSAVQIFFTGLGLVNPTVETGAFTPGDAPFPAPTLPIRVIIDGRPAIVRFTRALPGSIGVAQLGAEIPFGVAPSSSAKLVVEVGGIPSAPALITVR